MTHVPLRLQARQTIARLLDYIGTSYVRYKCYREYSRQTFTGINERPIEFAFLFGHLVRIAPTTILDVGTGTTALPHLLRNCGYIVTAIDNIRDYWPAGMVNRHYHIINDDIVHSKISELFDLITCISTLEHIKEHQAAVRSMWERLKKGGHLILTCPYTESTYVENVYALPESSVVNNQPVFTTQSYSRKELTSWLDRTDFEIVVQEYWRFFDGAFWTCGEKIVPPVRSNVTGPHQLTCLLLRKR